MIGESWSRVPLTARIHEPVIDVTACTGPEGAHVMVNLYQERHTMHLTVDEALALARALSKQAEITAMNQAAKQ